MCLQLPSKCMSLQKLFLEKILKFGMATIDDLWIYKVTVGVFTKQENGLTSCYTGTIEEINEKYGYIVIKNSITQARNEIPCHIIQKIKVYLKHHNVWEVS